MQFVWKYVDDLIGKGLEWTVITELLIYTAATLVPLALPLSILFASLMTFGNLGENYELVAFKAAGVSLQRVMKPLIATMVFISLGAFLFSNYVLPVTNLKSRRLLYDITRKKPAINIKPNIFYNEIEGFSILINDKKPVGENERLYGITIYDHTDTRTGNKSVTTAEEGMMILAKDKQSLFIELKNGHSYEEDNTQKESSITNPFVRKSFKRDVVRFDLSAFAFEKTDDDLFSEHYEMLNLRQLDDAVDTILKEDSDDQNRFQRDLLSDYKALGPLTTENTDSAETNDTAEVQNMAPPQEFATYKAKLDTTYLAQLSNEHKLRVIGSAINMARTSKTRCYASNMRVDARRDMILKHRIEWHRKFTLSLGCLVLFFIGAPLGAIIKKGGLGMPAVISVGFFVLYYVLSITGEKMAKNEAIDPVIGMWMASVILLPLGIYITRKATSDSPLFEMDFYIKLIRKLFKRGE